MTANLFAQFRYFFAADEPWPNSRLPSRSTGRLRFLSHRVNPQHADSLFASPDLVVHSLVCLRPAYESPAR